MPVIPNPSPSLVRCTTADVSRLRGGYPAWVSPSDSAIVKHPACAAPSSSSGFVPGADSKRGLNEYGPSKAPLPRRMLPLPLLRSPFHLALAVRSILPLLAQVSGNRITAERVLLAQVRLGEVERQRVLLSDVQRVRPPAGPDRNRVLRQLRRDLRDARSRAGVGDRAAHSDAVFAELGAALVGIDVVHQPPRRRRRGRLVSIPRELDDGVRAEDENEPTGEEPRARAAPHRGARSEEHTS